MCGISGIVGRNWNGAQLNAMRMSHRGPDARGVWVDGIVGLAHDRLAIIDLETGTQPMHSADGNLVIVFNGEIYNYLELKAELDYPWQTASDTEIILAAYEKWGAKCLDKFIGMFALAIWNVREQSLFLARDRFGVKPLYYAYRDGNIFFASEIKALWAAGFERQPEEITFADYLAKGLYNETPFTFWQGIYELGAGEYMVWKNNRPMYTKWYELDVETDKRPIAEVEEEYLALMRDAVKIRFRSDVPVGVNLSGGLDSSVLLALVDEIQPGCSAFTFATNTEYDEDTYIQPFIGNHPWVIERTFPDEIPDLAYRVQNAQDEPYGGIPTLTYAKLFSRCRASGAIVVLDGNGMDEQMGGYDYYARKDGALIQGGYDSPTRPDCLLPAFRELADEGKIKPIKHLRDMQVRDITRTKLPHALRFNDRISMMSSVELRNPFMDHRLIELALRQPDNRKIKGGAHKWMLRDIAKRILPAGVVEAPKRPVQTPQREWLRGELRYWAEREISLAMDKFGGKWFNPEAVYREWDAYCNGKGDNSFFVWQWITLGML